MIDGLGREISYLRLSVTDRCNQRCLYCMPGGSAGCLQDVLTADEIEAVVRAAVAAGIRKVRVTGGEPLVRRDILEICRRIAAIPDVNELCLTTNGSLLPELAADLRKAGVQRLNISLDSLDAETYRQVTRGGSLNRAMAGLLAARQAGFERIKINVVLMSGINVDEIRSLAELTRNEPIDVRFIELMPIGDCTDWTREHYVSNSCVTDWMPDLQEAGNGGVARLYRLPGCQGTVGLISPLSSHFCPTCNRIRITADGRLKPCLHSSDEICLRNLADDELIRTIRAAIQAKPACHALNNRLRSDSLRNMNAIGG